LPILKAHDAVWAPGKDGWVSSCQENSYSSSPEWLEKDVLTPPGLPQWRMNYHTTTSAWKMPPSWHCTGHSGGYWQQVELCIEIVQAEQWRWKWRRFLPYERVTM